MSRKRMIIAGLLVFTGVAGIVFAQRRAPEGDTVAATPADRNGVPEWDVDKEFKSDLFTFVRVRYSNSYDGRYSRRSYSPSWYTDAPDSDLNFSYRLQQLTSLKVDPHGKVLELTDDALFDYPFIYMLEVAALEFSDAEVSRLRQYLLNGGFLMVDDFWGDYAWENFREQMKRVFPDRDAVELPLEHPLFHCVYDLKEIPQIPGIEWARGTRRMGKMSTSEREVGPAHYRAIFDDKGRMMAIICQNTDLGDGWEREGEEEWYFREFSEKKAYPMGINIVFYAMTH